MAEGGRTEERWFKIIVLIVSGFFVGFSIANVVYFNRLRSGQSTEISPGEASTMLWVNIIILIAASIIFIWSLIRLIFARETRRRITRRATQAFTSPEGIYQPYEAGVREGEMTGYQLGQQEVTGGVTTEQVSEASSTSAAQTLTTPGAAQDVALAQAAGTGL